eukprot:scaffold253_cov243-Pinguiococcus_pyrenoidosus.AAC.1
MSSENAAIASDSAAAAGSATKSEADSPEHLQHMQEMLDRFWTREMHEMEQLEVGTEQEYKNHNDLPLARIKRIMKSDEVRGISAKKTVAQHRLTRVFGCRAGCPDDQR